MPTDLTDEEKDSREIVLDIIKAEKEIGLSPLDIIIEAQKAGLTKKQARKAFGFAIDGKKLRLAKGGKVAHIDYSH